MTDERDADQQKQASRGSCIWGASVIAGIFGLPIAALVVSVSAGVPGVPERFVTFVGTVCFLGLAAIAFLAIASIFVPEWRETATIWIIAFFAILVMFLIVITLRQGPS